MLTINKLKLEVKDHITTLMDRSVQLNKPNFLQIDIYCIRNLKLISNCTEGSSAAHWSLPPRKHLNGGLAAPSAEDKYSHGLLSNRFVDVGNMVSVIYSSKRAEVVRQSSICREA